MPEAALPEDHVLAVVVTYNPGRELAQGLSALRAQVREVVVIDNGSHDLGVVEAAARQTGCELISNGTNLGIATALNHGVRLALERRVDWLATFDQDSLLPPGAIERLLTDFSSFPERQRVGILAMAHQDRGTQADYHHRLDILEETPHWRLLRAAITSGSLLRTAMLREMGGFEDRLFIDAVDHEFCLRMRRHGWLVLEDRQLVMAHSIGASTVHHLLGVRMVCTHHSALRRYYMTRNTLEVCRRNIIYDPRWAFKTIAQVAAGAVAAVIWESDKWAKLRAVARGVLHFVCRRFGPVA